MDKSQRVVRTPARQGRVVVSEQSGSDVSPPLAVKNIAGALLLLGVTGTAVAEDYNNTTLGPGQTQDIGAGDTAMSTRVNAGGEQFINSGGLATSAVVNRGGRQHVNEGGVAADTVVNADGRQTVYEGGRATSTILNAGVQSVSRGGLTTDTRVNSGGQQSVYGGGKAISTTVNAGGDQFIYSGGSAISATLNAEGDQTVYSGGMATGTTVNNDGIQVIYGGGKAVGTTVNSGGSVSVQRGGILDGVTTLNDGATLEGRSIINSGTIHFAFPGRSNWSGELSGDGQLTKNGTGTLTLGGTLNQKQVNLNNGSLVMDGLLAHTDISSRSGTSLALNRNTTLTGMTDLADMAIDGSSTWNITGDSLVNHLNNAGNIVFTPSAGSFRPHTLKISSLTGNGGTITLNTMAGGSTSPIDKVVIDGGKATGSTRLYVLNHGGLGAKTTGKGIPVIQAVNGATTDSGAFSMKQPLVAGAYTYSLYRDADQSWYLTSQQLTQQTAQGDLERWFAAPAQNRTVTRKMNYRDAVWNYAALPSLSMDYDRLVAGTADTRFRYTPDSRIWGQVEAGQLRHTDSGSLAGGSIPESSTAYSFFRLGGDLWQFDGSNAAWRAGVFGAIGTMRSDVWRDGRSKSAGTDRDRIYTGGAYLSGLTHGGLRVNGLVQASQHNLKVASNDDTSLFTTGKGWLLSAEVGRASEITPCLALEPQLQYTLQGLSLSSSHDQAASLSWSDSYRQSIRAGLKVGTPHNAKAKLAWWATPSLTQSYGGRSRFSAWVPGNANTEVAFRSDLSGVRGGLNGGVDARIRKNVTLGAQGGWFESLRGGEAGGYYGLMNLGVSFR